MLERIPLPQKNRTMKQVFLDSNAHSVQSTTPSTIISLPEITIHKSNHHRHPSPHDQSNHSSTNTLSFRDVTYVLGDTRADHLYSKWYPSCLKPEPPKQILQNVSGIFKSGMNAIMGPTGCGKSSLLDILACRKDHRGLSGDIFLNGLPLTPSFKYVIGYVVQDDIISGTLTVRENIMFSANVRLPADISETERKERVGKVIQELGLESCADTRVGTEFLRGVSGGERKRTCIGMELVLEPTILFLDEPTTGLDASTARNVMQCLSRLSKGGRTIIFSIHQPRYSIFKLFDTVVLMCQGKCIYHGSSKKVLSYFTKQGYHCDLHDNPADFVLDVLIDASQNDDDLTKLRQTYKKSLMHTKITNDINRIESEANHDKPITEQKKVVERPLGREIYYISKRTLQNAIRNPALFMSQTLVSIILGVLVELVFYNMDKTSDPGVPNRLGAIFFIVVSQIFSTVTALEPLLKERVLFIHENVSGYYRISTFFLTKLVCDVLPMRVIPSLIFSLLAYFMTGLQRSFGQFFVFLLTIFMGTVFGSATCFFISATIPIFAVALIIVVLIFVVMMIFSGFIVELASIFKWLSWLQWISAFRYASNILTVNEFRHISFSSTNMTHIFQMNGIDVLEKKELDYETDWDMWHNFFALTMMAAGFLVLAFIQLIRMKKTKWYFLKLKSIL